MTHDSKKTKAQLLDELTLLRQRISALEASERERERAEKALRQRSQRLQTLIENSLDAVAVLNADGTVRFQSPSVAHVMGDESGRQIVGLNALDYIHPEDRPTASQLLLDVGVKPSSPAKAELRAQHSDGSWHTLQVVLRNLIDDPIVGGILANFWDITERKFAEEALRKRGERLQALIENSLDNVAILNADGTIRYHSPAMGRVLGYDSEDESGTNTFDFVHPDDQQVATSILQRLAQNPNSPIHAEFRAKHRDGSWHTLEVVLRNLMDDPIVGGILANFRDITERKREEQERIKHAAAVARAEELHRSRQRMVTVQESVRRDIAQQLHGSVQNRLIILMHKLAELQNEALSPHIASEITNLRSRLSDVIERQVRPISHRLYPSILRRGLIVALQSLADQFEDTIPITMALDKGIQQRERLTPRMIPEQVRLAAYRIAEEALTNAMKHAPGSKVTLDLTEFSEGWFRLTVRDNGPGFDAAVTPPSLGTLAMQDYAEVAGGSCIIHSRPGAGTEVTATFPLSGPREPHRD